MTKLAAALLTLHPEDREAAKELTAAQYVSLFQFDHAELHAWEGSDHFTNLTPMYIKPHREKSARDLGRIAKVLRLERKWGEFMGKLSVQEGEKLYSRAEHRWPSRKIPSRPFPKRRARWRQG